MDKGLWGTIALVPAAMVFSLRAALQTFGIDPSSIAGLGPLTAIGGVLSLVGLALWVWQDHHKLPFAIVALLGHMVVIPWVHSGLGAGLVYLGTGLMVLDRRPTAAAFGSAALVGAVVRDHAAWGHLLVALGAAAMAWQLIGAVQDMRSQA